ncbi:MRPL33 isoform 1 [Pan troglodytes]|uniref:Mitochondrial ribosomal protein L33 n=2 Tax=Homininae TaxID=207598 RepID=F8WF37_HUMAN|nr:mitochondrial ribosomal protein L33 [Homo sapiens]KAI4034018.1 mitochondrial ribosomal protein L33 [Homo sapiens]PNI28580.1 MRPL33 isoform 1 [Pan troglodytes]
MFLSAVFFAKSKSKLWLWFLEDHRGEMSFSSHHIKGTYDQHDFLLMVLTLVTWLSGDLQVKLKCPQKWP